MEYSNLRLRNDNVLVKLLPMPETTPSGLLYLPKTQTIRPIEVRRALVMSVGPGRITRKGKLVEPGVRQGDTVLVPAPSAQDWSLDRKIGRPVPRTNDQQTDTGVVGVGAKVGPDEYRIVRLDEIEAVLESSDER